MCQFHWANEPLESKCSRDKKIQSGKWSVQSSNAHIKNPSQIILVTSEQIQMSLLNDGICLILMRFLNKTDRFVFLSLSYVDVKFYSSWRQQYDSLVTILIEFGHSLDFVPHILVCSHTIPEYLRQILITKFDKPWQHDQRIKNQLKLFVIKLRIA